jgi:hypothetical protein
VALAAVFVVVAAGLGSWVLLGGGSDETPIASGIEGATFEVLFDGTTCTLAGPEVVPVGEYSFVMTDTADRAADGFEVRRFTEGHSYQDAAGLLAEDPYGSSPEWDLAVPFALDPRLELAENQQLLSFRLGEPGPHGVILRQGKGVEPFYVWACGGFEVSQWW